MINWWLFTVWFFVLQDLFYKVVGVPEQKLEGELALVTGGGGGLGRLISLRLAKLGVNIVIWDIKQEGNISLISVMPPIRFEQNKRFGRVKIAENKIKILSKIFFHAFIGAYWNVTVGLTIVFNIKIGNWLTSVFITHGVAHISKSYLPVGG